VKRLFLSLTTTAALAVPACAAGAVLSLDGSWRFALDGNDQGINEQWFERPLKRTMNLPGSLPEQCIGDAISIDTKWTGGIVDRSFFTAPEFAQYRKTGRVMVPFWLQPEKYYAGVTWFQRDIEIPTAWRRRRVVLFLERPHWETRVWVDGRLFGTNNSLAAPHEYDLGQVSPGKHTLTIRVDNRMLIDIGENSHAMSDHTQGNWNGIVGRIELRSTPLVWIENVEIYADATKRRAHVKITMGNSTREAADAEISLFPRAFVNVTSAPPITVPGTSCVIQPGRSLVEADFAFGDALYLWDEFNPHLYQLGVRLYRSSEPSQSDSRDVTFGVRDVAAQGTQITVNGRKTFIRGTLECCIFPKTGHPPTDLAEWKRIIRVAKSYGLNLLRFHSYCPPEAAFIAADELGMFLQVETCWANQSTTLGDGKPVDQWVYDETDRILKAYGNHPSFILMPYGNEPGGKNAATFLAKYVSHYKTIDPRRLWTSGSGWPQIPENQFHVTPDPRVQGWGAGLNSRINGLPPETQTDYHDYIAKRSVPVISHEIGQWCVYPNFDEIPKYTGYLKPKNFEIFQDFLKKQRMRDLARRFLLASGKLQTLCYKEDIESALRTPGMGGFELLDLHDFPGQGTALVGVLDPFWEEKAYVTSAEYSRFCSRTVPLARLSKRVFATDEPFEAKIEIAHFGANALKSAVTSWKLIEADGKACASGEFGPADVPTGNGFSLGSITTSLNRVKAPARCKLVVQVAETPFSAAMPRSQFENDWDIWVYPTKNASLRPEKNVFVTSHLDDTAEAALRTGGTVLLTIPGKEVRNFDSAPVKLGFSSIFWNTAWTARQAPTTLGILCDPKHPALAEFPTDHFSNWQWWYLIHRAGALRLDLLPPRLEPIVRIIDDWLTARPLALVVEGKVGRGSIVICGFDLTQDANDPVSQQMRESLLDYMGSSKFKPRTHFTPDQIRGLFVQATSQDGGRRNADGRKARIRPGRTTL
jgi:hypothetical protein